VTQATSNARRSELPGGPLVQSAIVAFRLYVVATVILAMVWLGSNLWQVPADATAVVTRFGRVIDIRSAGLVVALPHPIDQVKLIPGPDRQLSLSIEPLPRASGLDAGIEQPFARTLAAKLTGAAGSYLTGDGGVVLLDVDLTYRVVDPVAYMLAETHVVPALNRVFRAAAVAVAASMRLDDFLVFDQTRITGHAATSARLRETLLAEINKRLRADPAFGMEVTRLDLSATLPAAVRQAFEDVLTATQVTDQWLANARTDATRRLQEADRERDRLLSAAHAHAVERVDAARTHTATVAALAADTAPALRGNLMEQVYRDRIGAVIARAGHVIAVDARGGVRLILPGGMP
jgi:membrane protease subunit HflK